MKRPQAGANWFFVDLVDLYDVTKYPNSWYTRRNPFDAKKITPL
jgi:hypothetical protein